MLSRCAEAVLSELVTVFTSTPLILHPLVPVCCRFRRYVYHALCAAGRDLRLLIQIAHRMRQLHLSPLEEHHTAALTFVSNEELSLRPFGPGLLIGALRGSR